MEKYKDLTSEQCHALWHYADGALYWKVSRGINVQAGDVAGTRDGKGYLVVGYANKMYLLHRIVFLMHHGYVPAFIDHEDRNRQNNRIDNLRPATKRQNNWNRQLYTTSKSGIAGVCWHKSAKKWTVRVGDKYLGLFVELADAERAVIDFFATKTMEHLHQHEIHRR